MTEFYFDPHHDVRDGEPWSEAEEWELRNEAERGASLEDAAVFLCRQGTIDDVRRKAEELGLTFSQQKKGPGRAGTVRLGGRGQFREEVPCAEARCDPLRIVAKPVRRSDLGRRRSAAETHSTGVKSR